MDSTCTISNMLSHLVSNTISQQETTEQNKTQSTYYHSSNSNVTLPSVLGKIQTIGMIQSYQSLVQLLEEHGSELSNELKQQLNDTLNNMQQILLMKKSMVSIPSNRVIS